jgi:hypothetical protein
MSKGNKNTDKSELVKNILTNIFPTKHISAALKHFSAIIKKYKEEDWEGSILKVGKFVEAVIKCLCGYCGKTLPRSRQFNVGRIVKELENMSSQFDDTIRILIPRACIFVYDIASNRGARHDPDEIDPNKMDAAVSVPIISWILAELIRFADSGSSTPEAAMDIVNELLEKKYPYLEKVNGRIYINLEGLSAQDIGLLLLNAIYPKRISRKNLINLIERHGYSSNAAAIAVFRLKKFVDDDNNNWKLRGIGRQKAESILPHST